MLEEATGRFRDVCADPKRGKFSGSPGQWKDEDYDVSLRKDAWSASMIGGGLAACYTR